MEFVFLIIALVGIIIAIIIGYFQLIIPFTKGDVKFTKRFPFVTSSTEGDLKPKTGKTKKRPIKKRLSRKKAFYLYVGLAVLIVFLILIRINFFTRPGEAIDSIAVLPTENLSGDPEQEYFADGMTDALICELAQISALRVISRTSVMQYKETSKPLPEIARELNVDAVVESSVLIVDDEVRITAQLIKAVPEQHLWANSYKNDMKDILLLHSKVAQAIAREIKVKLTPEEQERLASAPQVNPDAHEAYLKGMYFINNGYIRKGIAYFEQAIEIDPNYALAHSGLAYGYSWLIFDGLISPDEGYQRARAEATRALEIDETLSEAHSRLAWIMFAYDWDWEGAEREFKLAIDLSPGNAEAHLWYAWYLSTMVRHDEAITEVNRAIELNPVSVITLDIAGWIFWHARQYDKMIEQVQEARNLDPNYSGHYALGYAFLQKMMYEEAILELQKSVDLGGGDGAKAGLAIAYASAGKIEKAKEILDELEKQENKHLPEWDIAKAYIALGETDQAFKWLEKVYESRSFEMQMLKVDPQLDPLRSDPRFTALLEKVGFEP